MAIRLLLQGIVITGIHAWRLFAMTANGGKSGVFAQGSDPVILRMIKIIARYPAFLALIAYI